MSRIYEALKRAGARTDDDDVSAGVTPAGRLVDGRAAQLADYPEERREGSIAEKRPERPAALVEERLPRPVERPSTPRPTAARRIAVVPARQNGHSKVSEAVSGKVVIDPTTPDSSVEQYRRLAATLHQAQLEHGIKTVMISSAVPREGKTLTSANLAFTLSDSYAKRVLLIDGDLRRPSAHEVFGVSNAAGLGDVLRSGLSPTPFIDVNARLTVLPAGRPDHDPIAGLTSDRMKTLLETAAEQFDWVLLDSPPVGLLSDAALMRDLTDGSLLVIGAGTTDYRLIQKAVADLGRERIIGVVLNRVDQEHLAPSEYYNYYYASAESKNGSQS